MAPYARAAQMKQVLVRIPPEPPTPADGGLDCEPCGILPAREGRPEHPACPGPPDAPEADASANASMPPTSVDFRADLELLKRESATPWQGRLIEELMGEDVGRSARGPSRSSRKPGAHSRAIDPRLWRIIDAWSSLPRAVRQQMLALIEPSGQTPRPRTVACPSPADARIARKSAGKPASKVSSGERRNSRKSAGH